MKHELIEIPRGTSEHRGWLWTSAAFTAAAFTATLINDKILKEYMELDQRSSKDKFDNNYTNYQITNGVRNGLMAAALVSLGVYVYFEW